MSGTRLMYKMPVLRKATAEVKSFRDNFAEYDGMEAKLKDGTKIEDIEIWIDQLVDGLDVDHLENFKENAIAAIQDL